MNKKNKFKWSRLVEKGSIKKPVLLALGLVLFLVIGAGLVWFLTQPIPSDKPRVEKSANKGITSELTKETTTTVSTTSTTETTQPTTVTTTTTVAEPTVNQYYLEVKARLTGGEPVDNANAEATITGLLNDVYKKFDLWGMAFKNASDYNLGATDDALARKFMLSYARGNYVFDPHGIEVWSSSEPIAGYQFIARLTSKDYSDAYIVGVVDGTGHITISHYAGEEFLQGQG